MATSCCRRTSRVWASRRCSSRTPEDLRWSLLNVYYQECGERTAAPRRPVFNSALLMGNFCEATSKMLNSLKAFSVPALLPVGRQCKSRRRRNPSEMFPLKLDTKEDIDEFQSRVTKEENISMLMECAALRSHHKLNSTRPSGQTFAYIFLIWLSVAKHTLQACLKKITESDLQPCAVAYVPPVVPRLQGDSLSGSRSEDERRPHVPEQAVPDISCTLHSSNVTPRYLCVLLIDAALSSTQLCCLGWTCCRGDCWNARPYLKCRPL